MSAYALISTYAISLLAVLAGVAIYTEFRNRRFEPTPSKDRVFRCKRCGFVYTDDEDVDRSRCSQCGKMNDAFKF